MKNIFCGHGTAPQKILLLRGQLKCDRSKNIVPLIYFIKNYFPIHIPRLYMSILLQPYQLFLVGVDMYIHSAVIG